MFVSNNRLYTTVRSGWILARSNLVLDSTELIHFSVGSQIYQAKVALGVGYYPS